MKPLVLSLILGVLPAPTAAAPTAVGGRIDRPALRPRHKQGVELLGRAALAADLEATALNIRDLAYFRYRAWDGSLPEREKAWAVERMREEAREQRLLDRFAAAALRLRADVSVSDGWHMPFPADEEGGEWEAARLSANAGLDLARRLREAAADEAVAKARAGADYFSRGGE